MDPDSKKPLLSIADASQVCLDLFDSCFLRNLDAFTDFEVSKRQFRVWTNHLRVFSQGANLDTQLRAEKYDEIRQMVMLLLNILNENLSLGMQLLVTAASCFGLG